MRSQFNNESQGTTSYREHWNIVEMSGKFWDHLENIVDVWEVLGFSLGRRQVYLSPIIILRNREVEKMLTNLLLTSRSDQIFKFEHEYIDSDFKTY